MPILGLDIGGTKTALVVGTPKGRIIDRRVFPTRPDRGFDPFLSDISLVFDEFRQEGHSFDCVSISVGGPLDENSGTLIGPPHLPGWKDIALTEQVSERIGLPTFMMHDARAGAYAEWRFGSGEGNGARALGFITFATGFGFAAVLNGRLLNIPGEIGHWRVAEEGPELFGKSGSLEGLASGAGIALQAIESGAFPKSITAAELAEAARKGDGRAREIFDNVAVQVGRQCARLIDLFGLNVIALGTLAIHAGDLMLERIRTVSREESLSHLGEDCEIIPARLGDQLGDVASLSASFYSCPAKLTGLTRKSYEQLLSLCGLADNAMRRPELFEAIDMASSIVVEALKAGKKILTCGNGGSATDAAHLAEELVGRYRGNRKSLPGINLAADGSVLTCISNDFGFDEIFSRQVEGLGSEGDVLVCFTTSGESENINRAIAVARRQGLKTVAMTGKSGGEARRLADVSIHIPHSASERVQELHTFALHVICEAVEQAFS